MVWFIFKEWEVVCLIIIITTSFYWCFALVVLMHKGMRATFALIDKEWYSVWSSVSLAVIQQQYNWHLHYYQSYRPAMYNKTQLLLAQNNNMYPRCSSTPIVISTHLA